MLFRGKEKKTSLFISLAPFLIDFPHHSNNFFDWTCIFNFLLYCYIISFPYLFLILSVCLYITYFYLKKKLSYFFFLQVLFAFLNFHCREFFLLEKPHLFHAYFPYDSFPLAPVTAFCVSNVQLCD